MFNVRYFLLCKYFENYVYTFDRNAIVALIFIIVFFRNQNYYSQIDAIRYFSFRTCCVNNSVNHLGDSLLFIFQKVRYYAIINWLLQEHLPDWQLMIFLFYSQANQHEKLFYSNFFNFLFFIKIFSFHKVFYKN